MGPSSIALLPIQQSGHGDHPFGRARPASERSARRARRPRPLRAFLRPRELVARRGQLLLAHDEELPVRLRTVHSSSPVERLFVGLTARSDIDILCHWFAPEAPSRVSSFGSLTHFRKEAKPPAAGAATRCLDCPYEPECAYSAKRSMSRSQFTVSYS